MQKKFTYWYVDGDYVVTDISGVEYDLHLPTMRANRTTFEGVLLCLEDKCWTNDFLIQEFKQIVQGNKDCSNAA